MSLVAPVAVAGADIVDEDDIGDGSRSLERCSATASSTNVIGRYGRSQV